MLFSSPLFLFTFLPVVIVLFWFAARFGGVRGATVALLVASLFFYGWWNPPFLILLLLSVIINFGFGVLIARYRARWLLGLAVTSNLGLIGYFKYAGFLVGTLESLTGANFDISNITLPLAISFFTFQQIAYQVDVYQGKVRDTDFLHYCFFVTFFPQLIAGPIVHHREVISQLDQRKSFGLTYDNAIAGGLIFAIGLYKKVIIADGMAPYADVVFNNALDAPSLMDAWGGVLAYTFQLYFDFSGYSDMAIGLARIFGIHLPANFASPYKAKSIIDFWQRWHMTLSRFLRDYLYIPLGGNRHGEGRRMMSLMVTMLLGGLWHGASWTFVFWGGLHGLFLMINHGWRRVFGASTRALSLLGVIGGRILTFACVMIAWVFFRAETWAGVYSILCGMVGLNGIGTEGDAVALLNPDVFWWFGALLILVWFAPNTQQLLCDRDPVIGYRHDPDVERNFLWRVRGVWLIPLTVALAIAALLVLLVRKSSTQDFIYMVF